MKILLAPDKFKGTLTAEQAAEIEKKAIAAALPDAEIRCLPLADGGEGTVAALTRALGGRFQTVSVKDPLGRSIPAMASRMACKFRRQRSASGISCKPFKSVLRCG